jgi:quinol monooxygenase YgiN
VVGVIVVVGKVRTDAERRAELTRIGEAVAAASREEAGCVDYRLYQSPEDPDAFVFVEEWESREALDAHFATPHIATFMRELPPLLAGAPDVKFHDVSGFRTLADVSR